MSFFEKTHGIQKLKPEGNGITLNLNNRIRTTIKMIAVRKPLKKDLRDAPNTTLSITILNQIEIISQYLYFLWLFYRFKTKKIKTKDINQFKND